MKIVVMAANNKKMGTKWCAGQKTLSVYAGLMLFIGVPSILCNLDLPKPLSFDSIYNSTSYAQIRHILSPYSTPIKSSSNNNSHRYEDTKGNNFENFNFNDKDDGRDANMLVGFAHDPFRYSIPESDYLKGVRKIDPKQYSNKGDRGKRGVFHLYNMLTCATGCDPISYKGYGCYCGFLGSGKPTDGIDNCCRLHDECYENIYCPVNTVYFQPYYWKCFNRQPHCALENYQSRRQVGNSCSARLCECDRRFAMCVRRYSCPRGRAFCRSDPLRLLQNILMFR
nr:uncharacterized protein LOC113395983 [Vanessa tameamea]